MLLAGSFVSSLVRDRSSASLATTSFNLPACSTNHLFQLMKQNLGGLTLELYPGSVPAAECVGDHAILRGFGINAGGGTQGALFHARGGEWHFLTFVDSDTAGAVDACDFYPYEFRSMLQKALSCPTFGDTKQYEW